jgi:drug/metabolite transporter (DMT)-like permease
MVAIWGANFSVVKYALRDFPELTFNALRLIVSSALFLVLILRMPADDVSGRRAFAAVDRSDWARFALLAVLGHTVYQLCFLGGVARTSVANAALIFGCTPVTVALMSSLAGHERVPPGRWAGVLLSLAGLYVLVGHRATWSLASLVGDGLMFGGMLCWSAYSVLSQPILRRYSPIFVTGISMVLGSVLYVAIAVPAFVRTDWPSISAASWVLMVVSSVFALGFAYVIWYTGVQRLGSSRTAVYSNLTPIFAMVIAWAWLGEPISRAQIVGAGAILGGVVVTRRAGG